jgi:hypothetical protein
MVGASLRSALFASGLVVVRRNLSGFWTAGVLAGPGVHPSIASDSPDELLQLTIGNAVVYRKHKIQSVSVRYRALKHEIAIALKDGTALCFRAFDRTSIDQYRGLLRDTFELIYEETGFV